jgi:phospholipid-transporting ATPase
MSDDFVKLVSQANPALGQYQQNNNSPYPLAPEHQLDPFFDDDDDGPDSAFGRPLPMQSQASGLPLTQNSAPPAGIPQGWSFDDEDPNAYPGSSSNPGASATDQTREKKKRKVPKVKWSWPWQKKEVVLTGERVVALNDPPSNAEFCSNYVSTSKYNTATFIPKFLFGEYPYSLIFEHLINPGQNNSPNTPICFSCSLRSFSKYLACHLQTDTLLSLPF